MPGSPEDEVRTLLPHTWYAFFGRFGRLTPIQGLTAGPLRAGRSALISAPTASGKTEAAVAPLAERVLALRTPGGQPTLRLLVVSPTRALVNDLARRLRRPLEAVGLTLGIKSGDAPAFDDARPPAALITTPESLDSLLCRRPRALRGVQAILLDELHLLADTARGDQLLVLLERLDRVAKPGPQRCAASATFARADALALRFLGPDAQVITTPGSGGRSLAHALAPAASVADAASAVGALLRADPHKKLLMFANSRGQVEALAALLRADPAARGRAWAHHGSLARGERLRVEREFFGAPAGVCVATMTLELGIDIGDVDEVVLVAPPPNVGSLLQRVGRSGRRSGQARVLGLYAHDLERLRFEHLLGCADQGRLFAEPVAFRPTIIAQQALSLCRQNPKRWVSAAVVHERLPRQVGRLWRLGDCEAVLDALVQAELLRPIHGGRFVLDVAGERLVERGTIHSTIMASGEVELVDGTTGRAVGRVRLNEADRAAIAGGAEVTLALGGQRRRLTRMADDRVIAQREAGSGDAQFIAREAPRYSAELAGDFGAFLGVAPPTMSLAPIGDTGAWQLGHFLGSLWGRLLDGLLVSAGLKRGVKRGGPFFTELNARPSGGPCGGLGLGDEAAVRAALSRVARSRLAGLRQALGAGRFGKALPEALTLRWIEESVDLDALARRVVGARLIESSDEDG